MAKVYRKNKIIHFVLTVSFLLQATFSPAFGAGAAIFLQPKPIDLPLLRYLSINSANPYNYFNFLLERKDTYQPQELSIQAKKMINYFFLGISLPKGAFWVNLQPQDADKMTSLELARTDMGKVLLEQDLLLKKDVAQAMHPDNVLGKRFWERLYTAIGKDQASRAKITTSQRVWIVPDKAVVIETADGAFIAEASLKVLLENEYLANPGKQNADLTPDAKIQALSEALMKEIIIPHLTSNVNFLPQYAPLRQVYYSLVLAEYFKRKEQNLSVLGGTGDSYKMLINSGATEGLESALPWSKQDIWQDYLKSYQKGEYQLKRSLLGLARMYFSGGIELGSGVSAALTIIAANSSAARFPTGPLDDGLLATLGERNGGSARATDIQARVVAGSPLEIERLSIDEMKKLFNAAREQRENGLIEAGVYDDLRADTLIQILRVSDDQYDRYYSLNPDNRTQESFIQWLVFLIAPVLRVSRETNPKDEEIAAFAKKVYDVLVEAADDMVRVSAINDQSSQAASSPIFNDALSKLEHFSKRMLAVTSMHQANYSYSDNLSRYFEVIRKAKNASERQEALGQLKGFLNTMLADYQKSLSTEDEFDNRTFQAYSSQLAALFQELDQAKPESFVSSSPITREEIARLLDDPTPENISILTNKLYAGGSVANGIARDYYIELQHSLSDRGITELDKKAIDTKISILRKVRSNVLDWLGLANSLNSKIGKRESKNTQIGKRKSNSAGSPAINAQSAMNPSSSSLQMNGGASGADEFYGGGIDLGTIKLQLEQYSGLSEAQKKESIGQIKVLLCVDAALNKKWYSLAHLYFQEIGLLKKHKIISEIAERDKLILVGQELKERGYLTDPAGLQFLTLLESAKKLF